MDIIYNAVQWVLGLGATAMLPIIITIFGLLFGMKFSRALKSGLSIGIGFQGLQLVIGFLTSTLKPVVEVFEVSGKGFDIVDMGWQTLSAAAWATPFAALVVPLGFLLNVILLRAKFTDTLNVDIWNFWHFIFSGAIVYVLTDSYILGLGFSLLLVVISLKLADRLAPRWVEYFGIEGTTCTTIYHIATLQPIAWLTNKIIDKIPGLNKADINLGKMGNKFEILGDPAIQGLLAGALLALIGRQPFDAVIKVGVSVAAVMILMPRMVSLLMEGLSPLGKAAREKMGKQIEEEERTLNIGMDIALGLGDPTVITSAILMVPIAVGLALIIPGNRFFPLSMLASLAYDTSLCAMWSKGNLLRTLISSTLLMVYTIFTFNFMAPLATGVVNWANIETPGLIVGGALNSIPNFIVSVIGKLLGMF